MSRVLSKNTKFELNFIELLTVSTNKPFLTHIKALHGNPDIVFPEQKVCVFLDSDFWHGWQYPRWKHLLKNDFWKEKIQNNRKRDVRNTRRLKKEGWKIIRIWEHNIKKDPTPYIDKINNTLHGY